MFNHDESFEEIILDYFDTRWLISDTIGESLPVSPPRMNVRVSPKQPTVFDRRVIVKDIPNADGIEPPVPRGLGVLIETVR